MQMQYTLLIFAASLAACYGQHHPDGEGTSIWPQGSDTACATPSTLSVLAFEQECSQEPHELSRGNVGRTACSFLRQCKQGSISPSNCDASSLWTTLCIEDSNLQPCQLYRQQFSFLRDFMLSLVNTARVHSTGQELAAATQALCSSASVSQATHACTACSVSSCPDPLVSYLSVCSSSSIAQSLPACRMHRELCTGPVLSGLCMKLEAANMRVPHQQQAAAAIHASTMTHTQAADGVLAAAPSPAPSPAPLPACVSDPTASSCETYVYPDALASADIAALCDAMPDMPGCSIAAACTSGSGVDARWCAPFTLLATLCNDMPGMRGCSSYKRMCRSAGSVVAQCRDMPGIPRAPTWKTAREAVFTACSDHPMAGCSGCSRADCDDPLGSLASICQEMPAMGVCREFWAWCDAAPGMDKWCVYEAGGKYLPSMLMYFHQRIEEMVLWKEWRPTTAGQYAATIVAVLLFGIISTGLKTLKSALTLAWTQQRTAAYGGAGSGRSSASGGVIAGGGASLWLPSSAQARENAMKAAIIAVSMTLDYFQMLIAMTFNVGLFTAVIASYVLATLLFSHVTENHTAAIHARRRAAMSARLGKSTSPSNSRTHVIEFANGHGHSLLATGYASSKDVAPGQPGMHESGSLLRERLLVEEDEAEMADEAVACEECDCVHAA